LLDYDYTLVPINITKFHWFLIAVDLKIQKYYVIDSISVNEERLNRQVNNLKVFFDEYVKEKG